MAASLFDPIRLGAIEAKNRILMAPLTRGRATREHVPVEMMATYYAQRAGAGLIISEATQVSAQAQGYQDTPGLYTADQIAGWKPVTEAVHAAGGKIFVQLWHVGRVSHSDLLGGKAPVGPSALRAETKTYVNGAFAEVSEPRALELDEIPGIIADFRQAAANAIAAGFDGVEIHGANGYLLDQFLKDGSNQRSDDYGGSIENRARFLLEITRAVADAVGARRTGIRLSPVTPANDVHDSNPQPLFTYVVKELAKLDLAYIHIIEGATGGPREIADRPFDYEALKAAYREAGGKAAWMVNNGYDRPLAEEAVKEGDDLVAFGKPFISNPDLVRRLREHAPLNELDKATLYGGGAKGYTDYPALA